MKKKLIIFGIFAALFLFFSWHQGNAYIFNPGSGNGSSTPGGISTSTRSFTRNVCAYNALDITNCDYVATASSSEVAINAAINDLASVGGGTVNLSSGLFTPLTSIVLQSNVTLQGQGPSTFIQFNDGVISAIVSPTSTTLLNSAVKNVLFNGRIIAQPSVPTRNRTLATGTSTGPTAFKAVLIQGSLDDDHSFPTSTNFTLQGVTIQNVDGLPILIDGVGGQVLVTDDNFTNNYDAGFIWNDNVIFNDNFILASGDNCVSISRHNTKITAIGNAMENCAYNGIWISGYADETGPSYLNVTGNTIKNIGDTGILAQDAPRFGVIANNMIWKNYLRGPVDQAIDTGVDGIGIRGYDTQGSNATITNPIAYAQGLSITGNFIYQSPRAGVYIEASQNIKISNNFIVGVGTQFLFDGTTAISATSTTQNIGILINNPITSTNLIIQNNMIDDDRGTPYLNLGVYPATTTAAQYFNNMVINARNVISPNIANIAPLQISDVSNNIVLTALPGSAGTPISLVGAVATSNVAVGVSISSTINAVAGNLILMSCHHGTNFTDTSNATDTIGNIFSEFGTASSSSGGIISAYYAISSGTNSSDVLSCGFAGSVASRSLVASTYSGVATSSPLDVAASNGTSTTSTSFGAGPYTTTVPNELIASFNFNSTAGQSAGTGFTLRASTTWGGGPSEVSIQDKTVSSIQTNVSTTINGTLGYWHIISGAFKAASQSSTPLGVGINTASPSSTLHVVGSFQVGSSSGNTYLGVTTSGVPLFLGTSTSLLGGSSLALNACTSTITNVPFVLSTSTEVIDTEAQTQPGTIGTLDYNSFISTVGVASTSITTQVCGLVTAGVTPTATKYNFIIKRISGM